MSRRIQIPQPVADELMYLNRHICCICRMPRKHVQIHHIDGDPANFDLDNLAVLSLDCHSLVTGDEGLGRKYTQGEVSRYKQEWEEQCAVLNSQDETSSEDEDEDDDDDDTDDDEPSSHHYEESIIEADSHLEMSYTLDEGDRLAYWIDSDEPLMIMIMDAADYERWNSGKQVDFHEVHQDVYSLNTTFYVSQDGEYSFVLCNLRTEDANVQLDIAVWE